MHMKRNIRCISITFLIIGLTACSFDIQEREAASFSYKGLYQVSGYDTDNNVYGNDSLYIPDLALSIVAERKIIPELSNDLYSTVIYFGTKDSIDHSYGFFVGDTARKPCLIRIKNDSVSTEVLGHTPKGPVNVFCLDLNGNIIFFAPNRSHDRQICQFNNWTCDLSRLTTNLTVKNDVILTGNTGHRIMIADGVTVTFNNVTIRNCFICEGNATVVLAENSHNLVQVGWDYTHGFMNGGEGTTLTIEGSGELTADMSKDRDRAGIGGNAGDIIIKGGTITAKGGDGGAGIGGSRASKTGNITITGGNITAIGGWSAAGIGTGDYWYYSWGDVPGRCGNISITGGTVNARGGAYGAGIGSGRRSECDSITISSSVTGVTATRGSEANSIGAGRDGSCGTVTIEEGANVTQN